MNYWDRETSLEETLRRFYLNHRARDAPPELAEQFCYGGTGSGPRHGRHHEAQAGEPGGRQQPRQDRQPPFEEEEEGKKATSDRSGEAGGLQKEEKVQDGQEKEERENLKEGTRRHGHMILRQRPARRKLFDL